MISPQTSTPTSNAAIQDPFHRSITRLVLLVVPRSAGSQPCCTCRVQPDNVTAAAPATVTATARARTRAHLNPSCESNGGLPTVWSRLAIRPRRRELFLDVDGADFSTSSRVAGTPAASCDGSPVIA